MKTCLRTSATLLLAVLVALPATAQNWRNIEGDIASGNHSMFRPLEDWPDPNEYRTASGAPGYRYWQQRADYVIEASLDTVHHVITGSEPTTTTPRMPSASFGCSWTRTPGRWSTAAHTRCRGPCPKV